SAAATSRSRGWCASGSCSISVRACWLGCGACGVFARGFDAPVSFVSLSATAKTRQDKTRLMHGLGSPSPAPTPSPPPTTTPPPRPPPHPHRRQHPTRPTHVQRDRERPRLREQQAEQRLYDELRAARRVVEPGGGGGAQRGRIVLGEQHPEARPRALPEADER